MNYGTKDFANINFSSSINWEINIVPSQNIWHFLLCFPLTAINVLKCWFFKMFQCEIT